MLSFLKRLPRLFGLEIKRMGPGIDLHTDLRFVCKSLTKDCIIDAGANVGQSALAFRKLFPQAAIHCFEPSPSTYSKLGVAVKGYRQISISQAALGSNRGTAVLHQGQNSELTSLLAPTPHRSPLFTDDVEVRVLTIDAYLSEKQIDTVGILKSDCQGYDLEVLKGASQALTEGRVHCVLVEVEFTPMYEGQSLFMDIHGFLASVNFDLFALYPMSRSANGAIMEANALFVGRSSR